MSAAAWMAVAALITALGGLALSLLGQRRAGQDRAAANVVAQQGTEHDKTKLLLDGWRARAERAEEGETQNRGRAERAERRIDDLESRIDEQRTTFRHQLSAQEMLCREHQAALVEMNRALRLLVVSEIADEADVDPSTLPQHPHTD